MVTVAQLIFKLGLARDIGTLDLIMTSMLARETELGDDALRFLALLHHDGHHLAVYDASRHAGLPPLLLVAEINRVKAEIEELCGPESGEVRRG